MNEKIYCWGQVNSRVNTARPLLVQVPSGCVNVKIDRSSSWAWTETKVFSWTQDFSGAPEACCLSQCKILDVSTGTSSPLITTRESGSFMPETVVDTVSNFSGSINLTYSHSVKSNNCASLLENIVRINSDCSNFFALSAEGQVFKWAHIHVPSTLEIPEKIVNISCGSQHSIFTSINESVYVLGSNSYGQISLPNVSEVHVPVRLNGIHSSKVVCGGFHSLLLDGHGKLFSCGLGTMGQLVNEEFSNCEVFSECVIDSDLGKICDFYCAELTSFVKFFKSEEKKIECSQQTGTIIGFLHKHLVAAAERTFLQRVKEEVKARNEAEKKRLKREKSVQKALLLFENEILPNWSQYKFSKELGILVKKGIPSKFRGKVWSLLHEKKMKTTEADYKESLKQVKELYDKNDLTEEQNLVHNSLKLISLDITRTFNTLGYFCKDSPLNKDLQDLLEAACLFRSDIGYIQGMSYVAGMLLLNLDPVQAFSIFVSIISSSVLLPFYKIDQEGIQRRNEIFLAVLLENLPDVHRNLELQGVQLPVFLMEWFVTLYSKTLPQEVSVRVWDLYFYYGDLALFKSGITLMKLLKDDLLSPDISDLMTSFTHISEKITDPEEFLSNYESIKIAENIKRLINNL